MNTALQGVPYELFVFRNEPPGSAGEGNEGALSTSTRVVARTDDPCAGLDGGCPADAGVDAGGSGGCSASRVRNGEPAMLLLAMLLGVAWRRRLS